ncbi:beta-lactamase/transpeptidase-like protein [Xylariaceae sp. FL0594]|nr:beta-lactamase/transpeptidase-like protein [Xylariaceae sp. FL0594]
MLPLFLLSLALGTEAMSSPSNECVLAGPAYPSPSELSKSPLLTDAIANFESTFIKNKQLGLEASDTAWTISVFSSKENKVLFEWYYTPPIDVGVSKVDQHSVFRIASISKVFSVWSFLIEVGFERFNDPITRYVPELRNVASSACRSSRAGGRKGEEVYNDLDHVLWDEVTLGQLASHAAGVPRDPSGNDLAGQLSTDQAAALGLPPLNRSEIPVCGVSGFNRACTREEALSYILTQHPLYPTAHSPAYSNYGFALLSYAQEAITGVPLADSMGRNIFQALGMRNTSFSTPPPSGGVVPGGSESAVQWTTDLGATNPAGSIYSSTADMVKAGQAILRSTLLSRGATRQWLQPQIQTGVLSTAVGAPWEIRYIDTAPLPNNEPRVTQVPTKQGDLGAYHSALVLSPEHSIGFVILAAGSAATDIRTKLMDSLGDVFLPLAERQAREEARTNFAGKYVDDATNTSVTIRLDPSSGAGLAVENLVSRGVQVIGPESPLARLFGGVGESARLYPSNLKAVSLRAGKKEKKKGKHGYPGGACAGAGAGGGEGGEDVYESKVGFRATYFNATQANELEDPCLSAWTALGAPTYGQVALDDWVFSMREEDGRAESLEVRMLRLRMERVE